MKTQVSLMVLISGMISFAQPAWSMEDDLEARCSKKKQVVYHISPPSLRGWNGESNIGEWERTNGPRPNDLNWHPARYWIQENSHFNPGYILQCVFFATDNEGKIVPRKDSTTQEMTTTFGMKNFERHPIKFIECSFLGEKDSPGESRKYIKNNYRNVHSHGKRVTEGELFDVWGTHDEGDKIYVKNTTPNETLDNFPESATVVFIPISSTAD